MPSEFGSSIGRFGLIAAGRYAFGPMGFLRAWGEVPALMGSAPPATPPSTGTGVVVCIMG
jgi:hypothetical protein